MMETNRELLGAAEVAELLGYSRSNVKRLAAVGALPEITRVAGRRIWAREDVNRFREQMKKRPAVKAVA